MTNNGYEMSEKARFFFGCTYKFCLLFRSMNHLHFGISLVKNFFRPKKNPRTFSRYSSCFFWNVEREMFWSANQNISESRKALERLKEQYPVTAHVPNFDFLTGCCEFKICEESTRTLKNPFASHLADFDTTVKLLRITDQWYIVPVKFRFGRNRDFLALLSLPMVGGPREGKRFNDSWRLISPASFHRSSDNRERNTQK